MTPTGYDFTPLTAEEPPVEAGAPALPIEPHLAKAIENANFAKGHLDIFNLILNGAPREETAIRDSLVAAYRHMEDAWSSYRAALEVAGCRGQA
ncbi:hypothetical protein [Enterovirga rhinocerotis]|uniref:Uncharacterized protein n=1 Tax=Enterovirga rhinocerotis TaxID=1339210 RepID=A0A4R7CAD1_9HYPH|nr:hypothetical protein [Enterovirga rhinocerotis]TDR95676.1 hypothetical protein EV668_0060 [Enterovirga rhinocerotis]